MGMLSCGEIIPKRRMNLVIFVFRSSGFAEFRVQVTLEVGMDVCFVATLACTVILRWNAYGGEKKELECELTTYFYKKVLQCSFGF